jgi:hypothetical protein
MAGEWIAEKARGLMGKVFPGSWEEAQAGIYQGRCPGEHLHHGTNAATDCRIYISYGPQGQPPGIYCLHQSCKGVLEPLNAEFREAIFAKDENWRPSKPLEEGVVRRAPVARESWIPEFNIGKLRGMVKAVPPCGPEWFMERSPIDVRKVTPGEFIEHAFLPGERVVVFTEFKGPGDYLWEVGKGGYRLSAERGVKAVRSTLPTGGPDGVWYLSNPIDGQWHTNPRQQGRFSRRSAESVTAWRHVVLESDVADHALWLRFLAMVPVPVVAIYSSGGKSWHALVRVDMPDKPAFDTYLRNEAKRLLPVFGADAGAMTPVRLTRLPGCTRGGRLQRCIYLNPKADPDAPDPITNLKPLR